MKYYYRTELRFSAEKQSHVKLADYVHNRDKSKYKSVNDYILAAIDAFEKEAQIENEQCLNSNTIEKIVREAIRDEMQSLSNITDKEETQRENTLPDAAKKFLSEIN